MLYMMMIKADAGYEAGTPPPPALVEAMGEFAREMSEAGILLAAGGLRPTRDATKIRYARGRHSVIDGPFSEAKEVVGGYAIVQLASRAEAVALAKRVCDIHAAHGVAEFEMDIRPLYEPGEICAPVESLTAVP